MICYGSRLAQSLEMKSETQSISTSGACIAHCERDCMRVLVLRLSFWNNQNRSNLGKWVLLHFGIEPGRFSRSMPKVKQRTLQYPVAADSSKPAVDFGTKVLPQRLSPVCGKGTKCPMPYPSAAPAKTSEAKCARSGIRVRAMIVAAP